MEYIRKSSPSKSIAKDFGQAFQNLKRPQNVMLKMIFSSLKIILHQVFQKEAN